MSVAYGWETLWSALRSAVSSTVSLQDRLAGVIQDVQLLERDDFPDENTWEHFEALIKECTQLPERVTGEGTITATTSQMTEEKAVTLLNSCFDLFNDLAEAYGAANHEALSPKN